MLREWNLYLSVSDWALAMEKKECDGSEIKKGKYSNIDSCANECRGLASMFIFERNDDGVNGLFQCYCETSANYDGTCKTKGVGDYNLYKYHGNYSLLVVSKTAIFDKYGLVLLILLILILSIMLLL